MLSMVLCVTALDEGGALQGQDWTAYCVSVLLGTLIQEWHHEARFLHPLFRAQSITTCAYAILGCVHA
jgi:hypothetical protein